MCSHYVYYTASSHHNKNKPNLIFLLTVLNKGGELALVVLVCHTALLPNLTLGACERVVLRKDGDGP